MLRAVWWVLGSALPWTLQSTWTSPTALASSLSRVVSLAKESLEVEVPGCCTSWKKFMRMEVDGEACHVFMLRWDFPQSLGAHGAHLLTNSLLINSFPFRLPLLIPHGSPSLHLPNKQLGPTFLTLRPLWRESNLQQAGLRMLRGEDTEALSGECIQRKPCKKQPRSWEIWLGLSLLRLWSNVCPCFLHMMLLPISFDFPVSLMRTCLGGSVTSFWLEQQLDGIYLSPLTPGLVSLLLHLPWTLQTGHPGLLASCVSWFQFSILILRCASHRPQFTCGSSGLLTTGVHHLAET